MTNPRGTKVALALALVVSASAACSKHDEAGKASGVPPLPGTPTAPAPAAAPPPVAAAPPVAAPPPEKPADPNLPNAKIWGHVVVSAAMRSHVAPADTIYIVARRIPDNPAARGSLVAVKKVSAAKFPIEFELSAADMPFQNGAFDGDLQLSVRDNKSGDPIMRRKGDVFGMVSKVHVGAHDVKLALDQLQKEDESLAGNQMPVGGGGMPPGHPTGGGLPPGHP
jgi:cytochrome c-type biogenesis protein CcmH